MILLTCSEIPEIILVSTLNNRFRKEMDNLFMTMKEHKLTFVRSLGHMRVKNISIYHISNHSFAVLYREFMLTKKIESINLNLNHR